MDKRKNIDGYWLSLCNGDLSDKMLRNYNISPLWSQDILFSSSTRLEHRTSMAVGYHIVMETLSEKMLRNCNFSPLLPNVSPERVSSVLAGARKVCSEIISLALTLNGATREHGNKVCI